MLTVRILALTQAGWLQFSINLQICTRSHKNAHGRTARPSSVDIAVRACSKHCQTCYDDPVPLLAVHVPEGTAGTESLD